jgi:DNA-binding NarL/FixJ family response regulator
MARGNITTKKTDWNQINMATIVIADENLAVRRGLRDLLEAEPEFRVIGETGEGPEVSSLIERLRPDILVMGILMSGLDRAEITREVHRRSPKTRIVVLSIFMSIADTADSWEAEACSHIPKQSAADQLVFVIREAMAGHQSVSTTFFTERAHVDPRREAYPRQARETLDPDERLTRREREVLYLVGKGLTSAEVADRLVLSPRTVDMHRRHIIRKLRLSGQAALVRYALQHGVIPTQK